MFRKKKEPEPIVVPLTEKDIVKLKSKLSEKESDENLKVTDLKIDDIIPQSFEGTVVTIKDGHQVLWAADDFYTDKFKSFKKTVGGIFAKDVLRFVKKRNPGKYILIDNGIHKKIARLIEDDELLLFQTLKLIHGIIVNKPYMLVNTLKSTEKLTSNSRIVEVHHVEEVMEELAPIAVPEEEVDADPITSSKSLFGDDD